MNLNTFCLYLFLYSSTLIEGKLNPIGSERKEKKEDLSGKVQIKPNVDDDDEISGLKQSGIGKISSSDLSEKLNDDIGALKEVKRDEKSNTKKRKAELSSKSEVKSDVEEEDEVDEVKQKNPDDDFDEEKTDKKGSKSSSDGKVNLNVEEEDEVAESKPSGSEKSSNFDPSDEPDQVKEETPDESAKPKKSSSFLGSITNQFKDSALQIMDAGLNRVKSTVETGQLPIKKNSGSEIGDDVEPNGEPEVQDGGEEKDSKDDNSKMKMMSMMGGMGLAGYVGKRISDLRSEKTSVDYPPDALDSGSYGGETGQLSRGQRRLIKKERKIQKKFDKKYQKILKEKNKKMKKIEKQRRKMEMKRNRKSKRFG